MFSNRSIFAAAPLAVAASLAQAQISDGVVKIGVLSDMSSLYSDIGGGGSVVAARMAIADFPTKGMKVELLSVADRHYVMEGGRVVDMIPNAELESSLKKLHEYLGV